VACGNRFLALDVGSAFVGTVVFYFVVLIDSGLAVSDVLFKVSPLTVIKRSKPGEIFIRRSAEERKLVAKQQSQRSSRNPAGSRDLDGLS